MPPYAVRPTTQCHACHRLIDAEAVVCTGCGVMQPAARALDDKKILPVFLLAFLLGPFGVHRFFVGKVVDLVMIITGNFTDKDGNKLTEWT